jgi:hypothetical protein
MGTRVTSLILHVCWLGCLSAYLFSCTSEESKIKDLAVDEAKSQLLRDLKKNANEYIDGKKILKENYYDKVIDQSEFEVMAVDKSDSAAKVRVKTSTISPKIRQALVEIIAKVPPSRENNFNVPDALSMISSQMGIPRGSLEDSERTVILEKSGDNWKVRRGPGAE